MLMLSVSACGDSSSNDKLFNKNDPIQITDAAGRQVSFPEPAMTVATTWGGSVDPYLFALGVTDRIVATNASNDFHKILIPDLENMKSVGRWTVDKEALADLSPDVFIHGMAGIEFLNDANEVGIRSIGLNFNTFEDIQSSIILLGQVFGVEDRATYVNEYCNSIKDIIESHIATVPENEKPTVLVMGEEAGTVQSDIYNTIEAMVKMAGGVSSVPEDITQNDDFTNVGLETIFDWNPDFLFLESYYSELSVDGILSDPTWAAMTSVQNEHVYALPCMVDCWSQASPSCYLGALFISMQLYPDAYSDVDFESVVIDFYHNVYGIDVTREQMGF